MANRQGTRHMGPEQRRRIAEMLGEDTGVAEIASELGCHRSTIYNELNRNSDWNGKYDPEAAQARSEKRSRGRGPRPKFEKDKELAEFVSREILEHGMSPEAISRRIRDEGLFGGRGASSGTIYKAIDDGNVPGVTREALRRGTTRMFSGGQLRVPGWAMEKAGFKDGDVFEVEADSEGRVTFRKI